MNEHALDLARKNIPSGKFHKENITKLPFEDSSVENIYNFESAINATLVKPL